MKIDKDRKVAQGNETDSLFESDVYEFQIPGTKTPSGHCWYQLTDGSQFSLVNCIPLPQIVCRFHLKSIDTFIPDFPKAIKINIWKGDASKSKCPLGVETNFLEWILRTQYISISARDDPERWEVLIRRLKYKCALSLIAFNREEKPYLTKICCPQSFRRFLEVCPYTRMGLIAKTERAEQAHCWQ